MGELLERVYGILFQPVETLRDISRERPMGEAVLVLIVVTMFTTWTGYFTLWSNGIFICAAVLVTLVLWYIGTAIVHLTAELFAGNGHAKGLLAANGFIQVPRIFTVPLLVLLSFMPDPVRTGMMLIGGIGIMFWEIILSVIAVRENYGFSTGRSFLVLVAPYAAVVLFISASTIVMAKIFMQTMSHMGLGGIIR
jgi:hypothetical protein